MKKSNTGMLFERNRGFKRDRNFEGSHRTKKLLPLVSRCFVLALIFIASTVSMVSVAESQVTRKSKAADAIQGIDQIRFRSPDDGMVAVVSGQIRRMTRKQIEIQSSEQKLKRILWKDVLSYQVNSSESFRKAKQLASTGNLFEARKAFSRIEKSGKSPSWLRRLAVINRIHCLQGSGQESSAMTVFLAFSSRNSKWIPWEAVPLCWQVDPIQAKRVTVKVRSWMATGKNPIKVLIAASYGMNIPGQRERSISLLKKLVQSKDNLGDQAVAADLAAIQLLRLGGRFSEKDKAKFDKVFSNLPFEARPGPMIFLGSKLKLLGKKKEASVLWLQVASQYPDNFYLSLLGLNNAFYSLQSFNDPQAMIVGRWLKRRFPDSIQARSLPKF